MAAPHRRRRRHRRHAEAAAVTGPWRAPVPSSSGRLRNAGPRAPRTDLAANRPASEQLPQDVLDA
eukprot:15193420-Alexandrium_andersonii.AAC.1